MPNQCTSYNTMNDQSRLSTYNSGCCPCDSGYTGWYRVTGLSGTRLATFPVSSGYCSSSYPVWFNGTLPSRPGTTTIGSGCANYNGNLCHPSYSVSNVFATECNGFYVFYLTSLYCCCGIYPRYCTV